ncbi:GNAT family N-acetyltransferase [Rhodococcoides yunnanense]|uniref:GNAT family N-acetyltransferase n=1 Tax=Rhodococcoides yunnanense TaxID=278209 RepID=UPI000934D34A|nr:GNAT family N-acetyltransferase [Rhodococcus yunnanensis]
MNLRLRDPADLPECVAALREVHDADGYPNVWPNDAEDWLQPPGTAHAIVAEFDGRIVGHAVVVERDHVRWVSRLFVLPGARGLRVGEALLAEARRIGANMLDVVEQSDAAIALYERTGWTLVYARQADWVMADGSRPIERIYAWDPADN